MQKKILAVLLASMFVGNAWAEDKTITITAQDMPSALHSLASQTGIQLLFTADDLKNIQAKAISGSMSVEEALKRLLEGTNYTYRATGNGTFVLQRIGAKAMLNEVTVTATRTERNVDDVPASVSVLTAEKLKTKNRQNVYDALRDFEGLDFVAQQGVGHQVSPQIRGFSDSGKATQVLVDGIALDSVVSQVMGRGGLNFASLQDVERVEVVRGPVSALYGPGTLGGVINVIPKRWKGAPGVEVNAAYGTHNTQTLGAAVGMAKETFDIRVSAYDAKSDGYIATPKSNSSGQWDLGSRPWKDKKNSLLMGVRPADNHELTLGYQQYSTEAAGYGGRINDGQTLDGKATTLSYRYDLNADTNLKVNYRTTHLKQNYYFDQWDWNSLTQNLALAYYGERDSVSTAFQALLETRPLAENQLILGYGHDTGDHKSWGIAVGGTKSVSESTSKTDALFLQDEQRFGDLSVTLGARNDRIDLSPDTVNGVPKNGSGSVANVFNPRLGARYRITDATSVYASYGTAYAPALNLYRYVQPTTTRIDNPDLKPESSATYEVGMNNRFDIGTLRTSLYHTDFKDKITYVTNVTPGKGQYQNIAVAKVDGVEIAYQGDLGHGWLPYSNFSYTKARDYAKAGAPGTQSIRIAPRKFNAGVTYAPSDVWSATLNARYVSDLYFNNLTEAQRADAYTQVDAKVSYRLPYQEQRIEAYLAVNNLTDKKYESFNKMEWADGRTITIGVSAKI